MENASSQNAAASSAAKRDVVLFDLDGTLLNTYNAILSSLRYATEKVLGAPLPDKELTMRVGQPLKTQIEHFTDDPALQEELLLVYRADNENDLNKGISPFDGVRQMLDELSLHGFRCGVVTSKRRAIALDSLEYFGLTEWIEQLVGLEDSERHKPDPQPLQVGAQAMGAPLDECIYVGDSPYDIQAAHAAGIPSIGVTYGLFFSRDEVEQERPTLLVDSVDGIVAACESLRSNV